MYDDLLKENNPKQALLVFFQSPYKAGATQAGWNVEEMNIQLLSEL